MQKTGARRPAASGTEGRRMIGYRGEMGGGAQVAGGVGSTVFTSSGHRRILIESSLTGPTFFCLI